MGCHNQTFSLGAMTKRSFAALGLCALRVKAFSYPINTNPARSCTLDATRSTSAIDERLEGQGWSTVSMTPTRKLDVGADWWWRTSGRVSLAAGLVAISVYVSNPVRALAEGLPGSSPGCSTTTTNPSYTVVSCERTGLDRNGRLLGCSSSENCLSTSAVNIPGKLGSPWEYAFQTDDADRAFASLVRAVEATSGVTMKTVDTKDLYLLAQFPSKVPPGSVDSVEFLVKPGDRIVLYRSVSRDTLFVYPLQRPVSDQGNIKQRLEGIRKELGWSMYTYRGE